MDFDTLSGIHISLFLSGFLFELHVAKVHYASSQLVDAHLLLGGEAQDIKGFLWIQEHGEKTDREDRDESCRAAQREATAPSTGRCSYRTFFFGYAKQ